MKKFTQILIFFLSLIVFNLAICEQIYDSDFFNVDIKTLNPNETKKNSINEAKEQSLFKLINIILDNENKKKFIKLLKENNFTDQLIQNLIIENEIITNNKYIASIKINFSKEKIINFFRINHINYTDIISEPYLIVSSYDIDFLKIGLDSNLSFNNFLNSNSKDVKQLIQYYFPNLDTNDRFILPYEKIIQEDILAYKNLLIKYNLNQLIYVDILKSKKYNEIHVEIKIFDNSINNFTNIGFLNFNIDNFNNINDLLNFISKEILIYLNNWWKIENQINNSQLDTIECVILSKNFDDLNMIKSKINNLSQIKSINIRKIKINNNIEEIQYYGDLKFLIKVLFFSDIIMKNINGCSISSK